MHAAANQATQFGVCGWIGINRPIGKQALFNFADRALSQ
jgi:hypothetical protein